MKTKSKMLVCLVFSLLALIASTGLISAQGDRLLNYGTWVGQQMINHKNHASKLSWKPTPEYHCPL